jgi:glycosyltransferase involved in cell wall biosynthesis
LRTFARKRIALLCEYPTLSGGENSLLSMLGTAPLAGGEFEFLAFAPEKGPLAESFHALGIEVIPFDTRRSSSSASSEATSRRSRIREKLAGVFTSRKVDLLHANSLSMGRLSGPVVKESKATGIAHLRDIIKLSRRAIRDLNCQDRLLAVSRATRDHHLAQGLEAARCSVLYNGVDLARFHPPKNHAAKESIASELLRKLHGNHKIEPWRKSPFLIISIGQLGLRKGTEVLLQAAQKIKHPEIHYLIVGSRWSEKEESRAYERELHRLAARHPLPDRIHFLGTRNDIPRLLQASSLLVHTARQEPLGRVLLEAAATALPIIATDVGGTKEIFQDPSNTSNSPAARLIPKDDVAKLTCAIEELFSSEKERRAMGRAARSRMEAQFALEPAAKALREHYRDLLED